MKKITIVLFLFSFLCVQAQSNDKEKRKELRTERKKQRKLKKKERIKKYVNPKGKWFFGAELGMNKNLASESKNKIQGGISAEYYFARQWSVSTKIKYFESRNSFYTEGHEGGGMGLLSSPSTETYYGSYKGDNMAIPISINFNYRIYKNLSGTIKFGFFMNNEVKRNYYNYSDNIIPNDSKTSLSSYISYGLNYFITANSAVYFDIEIYKGNQKWNEHSDAGILNGFAKQNQQHVANGLFSIGYKYSFEKKIKQEIFIH